MGIGLSILHYLAADHTNGIWYIVHLAFRRLYYLPVILAALITGLRSTFLVALIVTLTYLPHLFIHWSGSLAAQSEIISDIVLLWFVGILAGYLSDRLRQINADKIQFSAIENLSSAFSLIFKEMTIDYQACLGLARSMGQQLNSDKVPNFTGQILEQRLDHLGRHLSNMNKIIGKGETIKKRKNLVKIITNELQNVKHENGLIIKVRKYGRIPHFYFDKGKIIFAVKQFIQSITNEAKPPYEIRIEIKKENNSANLNITRNGTVINNVAEAENLDDYQLSLALAAIKIHGGSTQLIKPGGRLLAVNVTLPIN
jgi:hypothetical protein